MKMPTFNKLGQAEKRVLCGFCGQSLVPLKDWNKRCDECKTPNSPETSAGSDVIVGKRQPAAIIHIDNTTQKVYVDKNGKEVDNPGYDLDNDPRGYNYTRGSEYKKGATYI